MSDAEGRATGTTPRIETLAIHGGQHPDPIHGAVMQPIVLASTFAQPEPGKPLRFDYSRSGNPTRAALEAALAALEGGELGFAFGSGCGGGRHPAEHPAPGRSRAVRRRRLRRHLPPVQRASCARWASRSTLRRHARRSDTLEAGAARRAPS